MCDYGPQQPLKAVQSGSILVKALEEPSDYAPVNDRLTAVEARLKVNETVPTVSTKNESASFKSIFLTH